MQKQIEIKELRSTFFLRSVSSIVFLLLMLALKFSEC